MKKTIILVLIALLVLTFGGCSDKNTSEKGNTQNQTIKIAWKFVNYTQKDSQDNDTPFSKVYLILSGDKHEEVLIGNYLGGAYQLDDLSNRDFPSDAILACQAYYAGGGDDIYVSASKGNLHINWRPFDEPSGDDENYSKPEFKTVKTISISTSAKVQVVKTK